MSMPGFDMNFECLKGELLLNRGCNNQVKQLLYINLAKRVSLDLGKPKCRIAF